MAINVKISSRKKETKVFELDIRSALNGDLMIFDHPDLDIIIMKEKKKIVSFSKQEMSEATYGAQDRLFTHLRKQGVVAYDSIRGGNVYGSIEGIIMESKEKDEIKILLFEISEWLKSEISEYSYQEDVRDLFLEPDDEDATELGEVPHEEEKGSIRQQGRFWPYAYGRYTY